ncbi:UNVERIFIED_CONTAM: hypothetical protein Sradi_5740600 [Sesamum radiatum]|uniref:Uncharacterized protein n=1 Tax=Sesamum radiatum TaxID=300843 RepID=A0AAW2L3K8_SESRA
MGCSRDTVSREIFVGCRRTLHDGVLERAGGRSGVARYCEGVLGTAYKAILRVCVEEDVNRSSAGECHRPLLRQDGQL